MCCHTQLVSPFLNAIDVLSTQCFEIVISSKFTDFLKCVHAHLIASDFSCNYVGQNGKLSMKYLFKVSQTKGIIATINKSIACCTLCNKLLLMSYATMGPRLLFLINSYRGETAKRRDFLVWEQLKDCGLFSGKCHQ